MLMIVATDADQSVAWEQVLSQLKSYYADREQQRKRCKVLRPVTQQQDDASYDQHTQQWQCMTVLFS